MIQLTEKEYKRLIARDNFLAALEGAGVDNWEGYSYACELAENPDDE